MNLGIEFHGRRGPADRELACPDVSRLEHDSDEVHGLRSVQHFSFEPRNVIENRESERRERIRVYAGEGAHPLGEGIIFRKRLISRF